MEDLNNRKKKDWLKSCLLLVAFLSPVSFLFLRADFFDSGNSICLSQILFKTNCLGCGMTRAIQHFIHFEFQTAINYNPLVMLVFPLLVYLWVSFFIRMFNIYLPFRLKLNNSILSKPTVM
jgi:hypothetical protein